MLTDGLGLDSPSEIEKQGVPQRTWSVARWSGEQKPGAGSVHHA